MTPSKKAKKKKAIQTTKATKATKIVAPPLVLRRIRLPHIGEEYAIYPEAKGGYCATCYVKYINDDIVEIDIQRKAGEEWYFYSLSDKQKHAFLSELLTEMGIAGSCQSVMVNVDNMGYHHKFD